MPNSKQELINKKLAIMGGTFDPVHYGHLAMAEAVRIEYGIGNVLFMPSGKPPHKTGRLVTDPEHRYKMCLLATEGNPYFEVSRMEIDRAELQNKQTYTIDTIRELKSIYGNDTEIFFIMGADSVFDILSWKDSEALLGLCIFIAVTRPGYDDDKLLGQISKIKDKYKSDLRYFETAGFDLSSSDIRKRIRNGKTIKYMLPEQTERYIHKYGLYKEKKKDIITIEETKKKLKTSLGKERFRHTEGVCKTAAALAKIHGADTQKAYTAALLHDCAKNIGQQETNEYCKTYNLILDELTQNDVNLSHSQVGADMAARFYNVTDTEILDAIKSHTTGAKDMSVLAKIIYLADVIEPNRKPFEGLEEIRKAAYINLNKALVLALESSVEHLRSKGRPVHPASLEVLAQLGSSF